MMMKTRSAMLLAVLVGWTVAPTPPANAADDVLGFEDSALDAVTARRLVRFTDQAEYERYFKMSDGAAREVRRLDLTAPLAP